MKKIIFTLILLIFISGCAQEYQIIDRESKIPTDAIKMTPETDLNPLNILSDEYEQPIPVPGLVNTAGAEDSPFITPEGNTLYFFFTPDVRIPVEKQVIDGVTGIYVSKKINNRWSKPERIFLNDPNKAGSDGCEFVQGNEMLFCSVREGYTGIHWFSAEYKNNKWTNWKDADFKSEYKVGELHITKDESKVYFHSDRSRGKGGLDIWSLEKINDEWTNLENMENINTVDSEGWPALNPEENELWITKNYGLWRSKKIDDRWQAPEQIISHFAGEATIDDAGNVYFVHHYYKNDKMLEADIYVAYKKKD